MQEHMQEDFSLNYYLARASNGNNMAVYLEASK